MSRCQVSGCADEAVCEVRYPASLPHLPDLQLPYCDAHADEILGDPAWLGAYRVTDARPTRRVALRGGEVAEITGPPTRETR